VTQHAHYVPSAYDQHEHTLHLAEGSWLGALHGGLREACINSIHHQAINRLGAGLVAEGWSDDGVIEVVRAADMQPGVDCSGFIVGVQWHPEFHDGRNPDLLDPTPLMDAFLAAALHRRDTQVPNNQSLGTVS
jgi:gamma-glutamyl-gamma-aminobutyrate hydrolase PuuD